MKYAFSIHINYTILGFEQLIENPESTSKSSLYSSTNTKHSRFTLFIILISSIPKNIIAKVKRNMFKRNCGIDTVLHYNVYRHENDFNAHS